MNAIRRTPPAPTNSKATPKKTSVASVKEQKVQKKPSTPTGWGHAHTRFNGGWGPASTRFEDRGWEPAHTRFNAPKPPKQPKQPNLLQQFWNSVTGGNK